MSFDRPELHCGGSVELPKTQQNSVARESAELVPRILALLEDQSLNVGEIATRLGCDRRRVYVEVRKLALSGKLVSRKSTREGRTIVCYAMVLDEMDDDDGVDYASLAPSHDDLYAETTMADVPWIELQEGNG